MVSVCVRLSLVFVGNLNLRFGKIRQNNLNIIYETELVIDEFVRRMSSYGTR